MRSQVARNPGSATKTRNLRKLLLAVMEEAAEKDPAAVGARIAQARREAGLTQDELSDLIGVGMRQIQYYESGDSNPYRTLRRISEATGKDIGWLLHGESVSESIADEVVPRLEAVEEAQARIESALRELLRRLPDEQAGQAGPRT